MPNLVNVEKIDNQEQHEKTWFQRFNKKLGVAVTGATALVVGTSANAAEVDLSFIPDFLGPAKTAMSGLGIDAAALLLIVIGLVIMFAIFGVSKGGIKKAGST